MNKVTKLKKVLANVVLLIITTVILFPLLYILNTALKSPEEFVKFPTQIVNSPQWQNFVSAWVQAEMGIYYKNSIILSLVSGVVICLVAGMASFPISRGHFKGHRAVYLIFIICMFLPGSLVSTIFIMKYLHFTNTYYGYILLGVAGSMPLSVFLLTGFVKGVPRELDEAATMDGCGYLRYMFTIAFPLMKPAFSTVFIFKFIGSWNDFIGPFLFLTDKSKRPLTSGLYLFMGSYSTNWTILSASIIIIAVPVIIVYIFLQRYFIAGMTSGAVKG